MKVSRATQVLSASVCVALMALVYANELSADAMATASFCDRISFLTLSTAPALKKLPRSVAMHFEKVMRTSQVSRGSDSMDPVMEVRCQAAAANRCWVTDNHSGHSRAWDDLSKNHNFLYLLTRRLQQDPLENMFGHLRQKHGCNTNPNVAQFISGLKHICIRKLFKLSEDKGNVEDDRPELLHEVSPFSLSSASLADSVVRGEPDDFPSFDDISVLAQDSHSHTIDDSAAYIVCRIFGKAVFV
ncbi:hypothetical protein HPB48_008530 [Haemaphysalis longicornis]|uniref:Transposable element P transposase-like RNase H C-terminal domain-containing protein n=1 Tax=Haemaphysalis longicornis TaxID=44386 RepID=A0A9J6H4Q7_HAELO|nr:hypothetical protein HPB48_008530 [Haemaphysalis longicornis]